jgi:formate dehydrogenase major subunit
MGCLPNVYSGYQNVTLEPSIKKMTEAWGCEVAGGKVGYTVTDMINVLCDSPPKLKAIYIMGENPMVSDPDLTHVEHALKNLEFLVVQDIFLTETAQLADVVLPASCYAEKDGTQTSTERRVQRWHKAVEPPGEAKADWQIICELGQKMGFEKQFAFKSPEEIFNEVAKVTPSYGGMSYKRLEKPEALHWPCPTADHPGTPILHTQKFATADGLGVFSPIEFKRPAEVPDAEYPFILTTGRCIWHWHTGSMTRRSPSLEKEAPNAWIEINTDDAKALGVTNGEMVRAITRRGELKVTAKVTHDIKRNEMFMPFHYAECAANLLTNNALDPIAKIPEFKACAVRVEKIKEA